MQDSFLFLVSKRNRLCLVVPEDMKADLYDLFDLYHTPPSWCDFYFLAPSSAFPFLREAYELGGFSLRVCSLPSLPSDLN